MRWVGYYLCKKSSVVACRLINAYWCVNTGCCGCFWDCKLQWGWGAMPGICFIFPRNLILRMKPFAISQFILSRKWWLHIYVENSFWVRIFLEYDKDFGMSHDIFFWWVLGFSSDNFGRQYSRLPIIFKQRFSWGINNNC